MFHRVIEITLSVSYCRPNLVPRTSDIIQQPNHSVSSARWTWWKAVSTSHFPQTPGKTTTNGLYHYRALPFRFNGASDIFKHQTNSACSFNLEHTPQWTWSLQKLGTSRLFNLEGSKPDWNFLSRHVPGLLISTGSLVVRSYTKGGQSYPQKAMQCVCRFLG